MAASAVASQPHLSLLIKCCWQNIISAEFFVAYQLMAMTYAAANLHFVVDVRCTDIKGTAEDSREAENIVHLIRVVGTTCGYYRCACCLGSSGKISGVGFAQAKMIGSFRHSANHIRSKGSRCGNTDKYVSAFDHFTQGAFS